MSNQRSFYAHPKLVPTIEEYVTGFRKIESRIGPKLRAMLINHYAAPCRITTADKLARSVGFSDYAAANLHYGYLGSMLARAMGKKGTLKTYALMLPVDPGEATNTERLWVMRENVARALEELGWVRKTSTLFFPFFPEDADASSADEHHKDEAQLRVQEKE